MMSNTLQDVVVVGAGIVGAAIAHELSRYELAITLIDREAEAGFGTSKANSGIIHGGHHTELETLKGRLEWSGNQSWDSLCDELGFGFARVGELTVALTEADLPSLDRLVENAEEKDIGGVELWSRDQICAAEPQVTRSVIAGVFSPHTAVVNPYEAVFGLVEAAVANGVQLRTNCPVTGLHNNGDTWTVSTPTGSLSCRFVVNAAGLGADAVARMAGVDGFEIRPAHAPGILKPPMDERIMHHHPGGRIPIHPSLGVGLEEKSRAGELHMQGERETRRASAVHFMEQRCDTRLLCHCTRWLATWLHELVNRHNIRLEAR